MSQFVCDRCGFEETRPADHEPWICPSCGWTRWAEEAADESSPSPGRGAGQGSARRDHRRPASKAETRAASPRVEVLDIHRQFDGVELDGPAGVAVGPSGEILILDSGNRRLVRLDEDEILTVSLEGELDEGIRPVAAVLDSQGRSYVATDCSGSGWYGEDSERVLVLGPELEVLGSFGKRPVPMPTGNVGPGPMGTLNHPVAVAVADDGTIYVAEDAGARVQVFEPLEVEGGTVRTEAVNWWGQHDLGFGASQSGSQPGVWSAINDMTLEDDEIMVLDGMVPCVHVFDLGGEPRGLWRIGDDDLTAFSTFGLLPSGRLLAIEENTNRMVLQDRGSGAAATFGGSGMKPGQFLAPEGMAVCDDGTVWVADTGNHRVQVLRVEA